jgi:5-deoxy-glucuronate isomerase
MKEYTMSKLLVRPTTADNEGCVVNITPASAQWEYVGFSVHKLEAGQQIVRTGEDNAERETCVVVLSGKVSVTAGGQHFENIGQRTSVFDAISPAAVYVPANTEFEITASADSRCPIEVALCTAPGQPGRAVRFIEPEQISVEDRGEGTNRRLVRNILPETEQADSLLIAEVITPSGNWSSYPPHKHDSDNQPVESALEETYYHRLNPPQGFAFQRVYTDDRSLDETMSVEDGDVVMVPEGYHPVGAPHGYDLYYLNVMAGPKRVWIFANDPQHDWIVKK